MANRKGNRYGAEKWHLCAGGCHLWHDALKENAPLCCQNAAEGSTSAPLYVCVGGKHQWPHLTDAVRCCDGFVPFWKPMTPEGGKGFRAWVLALIPLAEVSEMNMQASRLDENPAHLYRPM